MALCNNHSGKAYEAGCDEAGRGCLAGPVFAAAVILPADFYHADLNDSKQLTEKQRVTLRRIIEAEAISYAVAMLDAKEIDTYNILWASVRAMHKSLNKLKIRPDHVIVDGNKFIPYRKVPYDCIVRGDGIYTSIAAASVLAKTYRDDFMEKIHHKFPVYGWDSNKGYPTKAHRSAILQHGICYYHRKSFQLYPPSEQLILFNNTN
ncbi:MAG: ribonuclease HII [Saprospiraceae bacterium]|nr:ribonuclease HII [Saprospiraceae bacterium]